MGIHTYDGEETTRNGGGGDEGQDDDLQQCLGALVPAERDQQLGWSRAGALSGGHCEEGMRRCDNWELHGVTSMLA